jgi:hypothetical protein
MIRDEFIRKAIAVHMLTPQTYEVQLDLGFGHLTFQTVKLSSAVLEVLTDENLDAVRSVFDTAVREGAPVHVQCPLAPVHGQPTPAQIFIGDEPLAYALSRLLAHQRGEVAL